MKKSADQPAYVLHSVDHALQLLNLLSECKRLRVIDIAKRLAVSAATASRLITMLELHGFVRKDVNARGYVIGDRLREIGFAAVQEVDIGTHVQRCLENLAAETGETAQFAFLQGTTIIFARCAEGHHRVRVAPHVGAFLPAHASSSGKVLLSALSEAELRVLYPIEQLTRVTSRTLTSRRSLFLELDRVRHDALATAVGESFEDIYAAAVGLTDSLGRSRGALSLAAPLARIDARQRAGLARALRAGAAELSAVVL